MSDDHMLLYELVRLVHAVVLEDEEVRRNKAQKVRILRTCTTPDVSS